MFGSIKDFQKFRLAACQSNHSIKVQAVGKQYANIVFGDIEGFPRIIFEPPTDEGTTRGQDTEGQLLHPAPGTQIIPSGSRLDELADELESDQQDGEKILILVGIFTLCTVAYFASQ